MTLAKQGLGTKRRVFKFAVGAIVPLAALSLAVTGAVAQTGPSRAIQVIVPFSPGSATDIIPRTVMEQVSAQLGQPIIVENRPGAGSAIGTAMVARANPDGYTLLATSNSIAATPAFQENVGYDPLKDFAAVAMLATCRSSSSFRPTSTSRPCRSWWLTRKPIRAR